MFLQSSTFNACMPQATIQLIIHLFGLCKMQQLRVTYCNMHHSGCFNIAFTDIRLVNGTYKNQGRLEVQVSGVWGTVCYYTWTIDESNVACKQLGYSKALFASATVPDAEMPNWLKRVSCSGEENFIWDCANNGIGKYFCNGDAVVYLVCHTDGNEVCVIY